MRPAGLRVMPTAVASARYSRSRLTAACTASAASGANSRSVRANTSPTTVTTSQAARLPTIPLSESPPTHGFLAISTMRCRNSLGHHHDGADEEGHEQRVPRVEVGDVRELVGDDALELLAIELVQESAGDRDRRVGGVAPDRHRVHGPAIR